MRLRALAIVALMVLSACSNEGTRSVGPLDGDDLVRSASEDEIATAVAAFRPGAATDHVERSAVDSLTAKRRSELAPTSALLGALLPSPDGFGSFRLANLQVEDPNGDGRYGQYWYPPRVVRQECSAKVDAAPGPFAVASYLPGTGELGDPDPAITFTLMRSAVALGVQVQVFDEPAQRDAYLASTLEFLRDPSFTCGGQKASVQTYLESEMHTREGDVVTFEAQSGMFGGGVQAYTAVGDRVLLTVSVSSDAVTAPWSSDDLDRWLGPALDVALQRLAVADLP